MPGSLPADMVTLASGEAPTQQLLSGFQFFFLCLIVIASYYVSLYISAHAVGESTASLSAPLTSASRLFSGVGYTILNKINRRRNRTQVGAVSYEDVVPDDNDIFSLNQPARGAQ
ncbi:hypothetical protein JKF63_02725 [Porcisia hertigi]|uniref:Uncharacterized protein n=1 Tax=Porcisia hertigi TaxID=2761500 RepID=A0A836IK78_9TRYP|nr:hypothetical protein JKF63_02725 [Porcisia hertigi]